MSAPATLLGIPQSPTVPALLAARAGLGDKPLLICDDDVLSYADAAARSGELAAAMLAAGVGPGNHVGLLHPNGPEFVVAWLAAARTGAVTVPFSTFSTPLELRGLLATASIRMLLATPTFRGISLAEVVEAAVSEWNGDSNSVLMCHELPALRRVVFDQAALAAQVTELGPNIVDRAGEAVAPSDRMVIVHTSGSTSAPKGVIHRHGSLIRHLAVLNELRSYTPDEVLFSNSPFFWIGGFAYSLLGTLVAGATLVCSNATDAAVALDLLERYRPTMVNGFAGTVAHLAEDPTFAERDLSSIRRGNLWPIMPPGARPADPELRHNMLGMTEAGSVCLASPDETDQPEHRRGSFGKPVPGIEARIVEVESEDQSDCSPGTVGELWLRGEALTEGYLGRERHETFSADGWFRTGDLFHVDDDGFYYFHGRRGDMIKTAGANVAPRAGEAAILATDGLVADVLGLDDPQRGQIVAAAIRIPDGTDPPDEGDLRARLRERISAYKVPRRFLFLSDDDVPMLSSGKLDAASLREKFG